MSIKDSVSRETTEELRLFQDLVLKYTQSINLISDASADEIWKRHIEDSAQLWALRPRGRKNWIDLGSGGGFPAIVLAILAKFQNEEIGFRLIESDQRKSVFLRQMIRKFGLNAEVLTQRIEKLDLGTSEVISVRALARLNMIFELAEAMIGPETIFLIPKGKTAERELDEARESWSFEAESFPSQTAEDATILRISAVRRRKRGDLT